MSLPLTMHYIKRIMGGGVQVQFHTFLILALDGGGFQDSCPVGTAPSIHQLDNQASCVLWKAAGSATIN